MKNIKVLFGSVLLVMIVLLAGCQNEEAASSGDLALPHSDDLPKTALTDEDKAKIANAKGKVVNGVSFAELMQRMKADNDTIYLFNFWATWCKPCIEEMPYFEQIQDDFEDKNVKVVFVSLDNPEERTERITTWVRTKQIRSEVVLLDEEELSQDDWIPMIDKDWSGDIPATLFVQNSSDTRIFYAQSFTYEELQAIITPLAL